MGFFSKKDEVKSKLEVYRDDLYKNFDSPKTANVARYLDDIIKFNKPNLLEDEDLLIMVVDKYFESRSNSDLEIEQFAIQVVEVFSKSFVNDTISNFKEFKLFLKIFDADGIYDKNLFNVDFYRLFDNFKQYYIVMESIISNDFIVESFDKILDFFSSIRSHFDSGEKYYFEVLSICKSLVYGVNLDEFIDRYNQRLDKMEGIYNVDETLIDKIHESTLGADGLLTSLDSSLQTAREMLSTLNRRIESYSRSLDDINRTELDSYSRDIKGKLDEIANVFSKCKDEFTRYKIEIQDELKTNLNNSYNSALDELREEKERIINSLQQYEKLMVNMAAKKVSEITQLGAQQISSIDEVIKNEPHLKEILENIVPNQQTLELINNALSSQDNLANIVSKVSSQPQMQSQVNVVSSPSPSTLFSGPSLIIPDRVVDPTVSEVLDFSIPFDKRLKKLREKIEFNKSNGVLYNPKIEEYAYYMMQGYSIYLWGPSGSGKTLLATQIIDLLGIDTIVMNYINEEYEVKGSDPFMGYWSPNLIYDAYKYGSGLVVDEMDNGRAQANMVLNRFIGATDPSYVFQNREEVKRHPNFRLIATGNTMLDGPTDNHLTREKMDEAFKQRFKKFCYIDYSEDVESKLLKDYPHWYSFIKQFRDVLIRTENNKNEVTIKDMVTTKNIAQMANALKVGYETTEMILNSDFIRTHSVEKLNTISRELDKYYGNQGSAEEKDIYKKFTNEVKKLKRVI